MIIQVHDDQPLTHAVFVTWKVFGTRGNGSKPTACLLLIISSRNEYFEKGYDSVIDVVPQKGLSFLGQTGVLLN